LNVRVDSHFSLHSTLNKTGLNPNNIEWFADAIKTVVKLPELQDEYQKLQG